MELSDILLIALICVAVAPLMLVALLGVATFFNVRIADRILDVTVRLMTIQWIAGGLVNVVIGLGLIGLGVWLAWHLSLPWHWLAALALVAFGGWRTYRGAVVLLSMCDGH